MMTYFKNGTKKDLSYLINEDQFAIQHIGDEYVDKYVYPGLSLNYDLDLELVKLTDTLQSLFFNNINSYYSISSITSYLIQEGGQNSNSIISANDFNLLINELGIKNSDLYKLLYLEDCQYLVGTIQNLLSSMEDSFILYYITLANVEILSKNIKENQTIYITSKTSRYTSSLLETYFTKAYSILDILCKICFELQNYKDNFHSYHKIKSANKLWGDRKKLEIYRTQKTLLDECETITIIESLRNEFVHNGTWELNPKIFVNFENNNIDECYMLFPDMINGRLQSVNSRKHFFSKRTKVNDLLPDIHLEFKNRLLNTIKLLNDNFKYSKDHK